MSVSLNNGNQHNEEFARQIIICYLDRQLADNESKYDIKNLIPDELYDNGNNYIFKNANSGSLQTEVDVIVEAMLYMVTEFENKYKSELNANLKSVTNDFNSNEVISSYEDIILTLFDEKINAGRLIALFAFLNATVTYLCEIDHVGIIKNIIYVTLNLFDTRLNKWIRENDGWRLIVEMSAKNNKISVIDFDLGSICQLKKTVTKIGICAALELAKSIFQ